MIKGAYNVSAIFIAKDHAPGMQEKNFPPEADRKKMTDTFNKYYNDEWRKMIKYNVCKHSCNLAAFSFYFLAVFAVSTTVHFAETNGGRREGVEVSNVINDP